MAEPEVKGSFEKNWKGTKSEQLLNELWQASEAFSKKIWACLEHGKTVTDEFERTCFLNSASNHLYSGIERQRGGFTTFMRQILAMTGRNPEQEPRGEKGFRPGDVVEYSGNKNHVFEITRHGTSLERASSCEGCWELSGGFVAHESELKRV